MSTKIPALKNWELILKRPEMYLGRKSLFGMQCFLFGLRCAQNSEFFFEKEESFYFERWVQDEISHGRLSHKNCHYTNSIGKLKTKNSYALALEETNGDDETAFDVWAGWFRTYKTGGQQ